MGALRVYSCVVATILLAGAIVSFAPDAALAEDTGRQLVGGPYSLTIRGGGENNSGAMGIDARYDRLDPLANIHLFGTFDLLESGRGLGEIDNKKYGAGFAVSHTYTGKANAFAGTAFLHEGDATFGHAYLGGKWKVNEFAILSGAYGLGFGNEKILRRSGVPVNLAESADWFKGGVVLADSSGWKANAYYVLTDPGDLQISGVEGEVSFPVLDFLTVGVNGTRDLTETSGSIRNWKAFLFLTYAYGDQKRSPIDLALEKNNPVEYPRIVRRAIAAAPVAGTLAISPTSASATGCSTTTVAFTASGGTPPYTWSTSDSSGNLTVISPTQAEWFDGTDTFCTGFGTVTITVTDSVESNATATIDVTSPG